MIAKKQELEDFGRAIERALRKGKTPTTLVNLVCRHLQSKDAKVAAMMTVKVVEWLYGKPKEHNEITVSAREVDFGDLPMPSQLGTTGKPN